MQAIIISSDETQQIERVPENNSVHSIRVGGFPVYSADMSEMTMTQKEYAVAVVHAPDHCIEDIMADITLILEKYLNKG